MKYKRRIILYILIPAVIIASSLCTYYYLVDNNSYVKEWHNLPFDVKVSSVVLAVESIDNMLIAPEIDTSITNKITGERLMNSIRSGADWIVSMQEEGGRFNYWYDPEKDIYSNRSDDNFLRQAGTAYSLMLVYEVTGDTIYMNSAKKNINHLFRYRKYIDENRTYFEFKGKAKLGGIALPMLTMVKIKALAGDMSFNDDLEKLADMIIYLQQYYGNGKFKSTYVYLGDYEHEKNSGWESSIYPGEAMLAIALMYKSFGEEKYKQCFDKAYDYYSADGNWRMSGFRPWAISACSEMYHVTNDRKYSDFAFRMCGYGLTWQNLNPDYIVYGSIYALPDVFTATTFEGIGDAIAVACKTGDTDLADLYMERSLIAYNWLMKLQYSDNDTIPEQATGGFRCSLYDPVIRIDNTQHAISAMTKGYKYIFSKNRYMP